MHGISRQRGISSEDQAKKTQLKIAKYVEVTTALKQKRAEQDYSAESLLISAEVLRINSEYYTAWSFRRHVLASLDSGKAADESGGGGAATKKLPPLYDEELRFCEQLLASHPKSYWLWLHRTWLLTRLADIHGLPMWESELELCSRFLNADRRNFHGWNHRRWVAERLGRAATSELGYTTEKIEQDFSNYSAWQHRARLYQEILKSVAHDAATMLQGLEQEFQLVQQAFFTEPDDQSPWFYFRWLVNQVPAGREDIFGRELQVIEELLTEEPASKWALLTSIDLMRRIDTSAHQSLISERFQKLLQVDPDRKNYYLYLQQN